MNFLERDLEDIIWETDNKLLRERGLDIFGKKLRQTRIGNYGKSDLITYHRTPYNSFEITVFEFKKDKINADTFFQALRYSKGIEEYLKCRNFSGYINIYIVLVGSCVDSTSDFIYLPDFAKNLQIFTYKYDFDGIKFIPHGGYVLNNNGFNQNENVPF